MLQKALELGKKPIVVVNKVDKPNCRPDEVQEEVFDLMLSLIHIYDFILCLLQVSCIQDRTWIPEQRRHFESR